MSLVKQLAGDTVIYGLGQILPRIFHFFVFNSYLTYRLGADTGEYGIYLGLYAYASILIVIFSFRMDTAFFRYASKDYAEQDVMKTALGPVLISCIVLLLIGFGFAEEIATLITYPGKGYYVKWFACIIALDVLALLPMARLRLQERAKTFVSFKLFNVFITVLLVLLCFEVLPRGEGSWLSSLTPSASSDIDFVFLSNLIASALMLIGLSFVYPILKGAFNFQLFKRMLMYSWPLVIVGIAASINQFFGVPLQTFLLGEDYEANQDTAGIYGAVQKIAALLAMVTTAYNYAAEPFFFKNSDHTDKRALFGDIALFFVIVVGAVAIGIYTQLDILQYLIDDAYRSGLYLVPILLLAYLFLGLYYNVSIWYKLADKTHFGAMISSIGAFITLGISLLFLPTLGMVASAYAALACYACMVLLVYLLGQKHYPIDYPIYSLARTFALIIIAMLVAHLFRSESVWINVALGLALLMTYAFLVYRLEEKKINRYF